MSYSREQLKIETQAIGNDENQDVLTVSSTLTAYYLDHCEITVPKANRFFVRVNCDRLMSDVISARTAPYKNELLHQELAAGYKARAYTGEYDFGHTSADWESVISLGIFGLRERIADYAKRNAQDSEKANFYRAALKVYDSGLSFIRRAAQQARAAGKEEMADGLDRLTTHAPATLFEAMQTTLIYYTMQHMAEGANLRTLGRLDSLYLAFYNRETDQDYVKGLIADFLAEIDLLGADSNIPFALGAAYRSIGTSYTPLTKLFISAYRNANCKNTKFHLLCRHDIPTDILEEAFCSIREGNNSLIFMSDERIIQSLIRLGEHEADAQDYHVVGCYECGGKDELTCSCNARVNLPKAIEYAFTGGVDMLTGEQIGMENSGNFESFDEFLGEVLRQMEHLARCAMRMTEYYERHYSEIFAAPVLSSTYVSALEKGGDLYRDSSAKYNNSSLNALGLATAVDSLAAIRKLVFEDKEMSLAQVKEMLKTNWKGNELIRLRIKNRFPKYGVGDAKTDCLASHIVEHLAKTVNRKPNARGGVWRLGTFSIDWRWEFGEKTAASANGRLAGEPLSQNTGATFGADKEGATAHMRSVASIDSTNTPNGSVLDLDLHISAAEGQSGLHALVAGLRTYFELGGFAVHYNILDAQTLERAKACPEDYPNLQVRLCGWNVLFSSLSDREKDEFIARFATRG